jgi:hypothetical protein
MPDDTVTTSWKRSTDKVQETSSAGLSRPSLKEGVAPSSAPASAESAPLASRLQVPVRRS